MGPFSFTLDALPTIHTQVLYHLRSVVFSTIIHDSYSSIVSSYVSNLSFSQPILHRPASPILETHRLHPLHARQTLMSVGGRSLGSSRLYHSLLGHPHGRPSV